MDLRLRIFVRLSRSCPPFVPCHEAPPLILGGGFLLASTPSTTLFLWWRLEGRPGKQTSRRKQMVFNPLFSAWSFSLTGSLTRLRLPGGIVNENVDPTLLQTFHFTRTKSSTRLPSPDEKGGSTPPPERFVSLSPQSPSQWIPSPTRLSAMVMFIQTQRAWSCYRKPTTAHRRAQAVRSL